MDSDVAGTSAQTPAESPEDAPIREWQPLSVREFGAAPQALVDLPDLGLAHALAGWLTSIQVSSNRTMLAGRTSQVTREVVPWQRVALRLNLTPRLDSQQRAEWRTTVLAHVKRPEHALDIVDAALHLEARAQARAQSLDELLSDAGSAWCVRLDRSGLVRRVDPNAASAYEMAMTSAEKARDRLSKAWSAAYGLHPDPGAAYRHAVAAVEAVAIPLFVPADSQASLGRVRAHLDQGRAKYVLAISNKAGDASGIESIIEMVSTLWHGQRDRHEGGTSSAPITQEAAEAAVHLAVLLVQWFATGAVQPRRPA
ncbi:hypothetical protein OG765_25160 [Streptomyces sp. NBC_00555]|uniref:hypothetical protein n=1 Tax=Streptomyces sp. NBC_00555 TaxID=2903662 RepID=UPI0022542C15|nr:hypothetical protein [Streptomyces sp. NBC_00555]MCX5014249.1 hypothetical protein [Streptomyces sp. NBC_00555]